MSDQERKGDERQSQSFLSDLPLDDLMTEIKNSVQAIGSKAVSQATDKLTSIGDGSSPIGGAAQEGAKAMAEGESPVKGVLKGGMSGLKDKVTGAIPGLGGGSGNGDGGGGNSGGDPLKAMNIAEAIDVGVPIRVAYNQWTQFDEFPDFMKKVESADAEEADEDSDEISINFKAQIMWSHRNWTGTIIEQVPDDHIVWRSEGQKGYVDGAVTFHELGPRLTRILVVLEYYPQGVVEKVGNLWRSPGRRARLELKHFRRHVMMNTILNPDDVEGWRGEIRDSEVVETHEEAAEREQQEQQDQESAEGEYEDEYEYEEEPEEEPEGEYEDEEAEDEYEEEPEDEYEYEDEEAEDEPAEEAPAR